MRDLELLRGATVAELRLLRHSERKLVVAGMLMAHTRADDTDSAIELAHLVRERRLNRMLGPDPVFGFLALEAALAEAFISAGATVDALVHTERLVQGMSEVSSPRWHLRAFGLCAAANAIDGNHRAAQDFLDRISVLKRREGWEEQRVEYMDAVAETVLGFTALDASRLRPLRDSARTLPEREPTARSLVNLIEMATLTLTAEANAADLISGAGGIARGSHQPSGPYFVRICAIAIAGVALTNRGTPAQTIALLRGTPTPRHHSVCIESVRAAAFLAMGDPRAALAATDACVRGRASHNRWMLPATLLRRAIANMRLGHTAEAVANAADAVSLSDSLVSPRLGFISLPKSDLLALGSLLAVTQPRLAGRLLRMRPDLSGLPKVIPPAMPLPRLSQRERIVALRLRSDQSYTQLADELHVSASTIKSQANTIARKLGGRTREEAVARLEKSGFFAIYAEEDS